MKNIRKIMLPILFNLIMVISLMAMSTGTALAAPDGTYDFSGYVITSDSAGPGFMKLGDLFKVPNTMFGASPSLGGSGDNTALFLGNKDATTAVLKAEGSGTCSSFTFNNLGLSAFQSSNHFTSLRLVLKDDKGSVLSDENLGPSATSSIPTNSIVQLSTLYPSHGVWDVAGVSTIEITFTLNTGDVTYLTFENITISNVSDKYLNATAPVISGQPFGTTVNVGGTANLTVTASVSSGTLSYKWYSNTTDSNSGGSLISGATSATYSAPTTSIGTTYYYCEVTNTDSGAINSTSTVTSYAVMVLVNDLVNAAVPTISGQPQNTTVAAGNPAAVTVTASVSSGTLSYQWYSSTTNSTTGGNLISGATNATYTVTPSSIGTIYYYCVVTNTDTGATGNKTASITSEAVAINATHGAGVYDFSGLVGISDSAGTGFMKLGDLFKVPNIMFGASQTLGGPSGDYTALSLASASTTTAVLKAEGIGTCSSFTFKDLGLSAFQNVNHFTSLRLVLKDDKGIVLSDENLGPSATNSIPSDNIVQLSTLYSLHGVWDVAGVSTIEITFTLNTGDVTYLTFENITISDITQANTTPASTLTGTATISNTAPRIGDVLNGTLVSSNNTGTLTYVWKAAGVQVGTGSSYTVAAADLGKMITLEIQSSIETGTRTSAATAAVLKKAAPLAPGAPTLNSKTHNTVTLTANAAYEFSKDGTTWQAGNIFSGLTASTTYTFYQRIAATADTEASTASTGLTETTDTAPAGTLTGTATISNTAPRIGDVLNGTLVSSNNTGTLTYVWKAAGVQVGTGSSYTVAAADLGKMITLEIQSSIETGTRTSAATAAVLKKAAPLAPGAPTLNSKTHNTVTLTANAAYEFSKDGTTWQTSNVFTGLTASTTYTFYQRIAATADTEVSAASVSIDITTDSNNSSSGGSSGSGGGGTAAQATIPAANGAAQVNYTASNGTVVLSLPTAKVSEIIEKSTSSEAVLDLSKISDVMAATFPTAALTAFEKAGLDTTVKLSVGTITLDDNAAASVSQQATGGNVSIELKQAATSSITDAQKETVKSSDILLDINIISGTKKITEFDGNLTVSMPYTGPQPVSVWYLNDKGELEKLDSTFKNGVVSFKLDHLSLYVVRQDTAKPTWVTPFSDIKESDWFYVAVSFCAEKGITNGTSATTFSPNATLTRGQFITMLLTAYGIDPVASPTDNFADAGNTYYTGYLAAAKAKGISNGVGNNKFAPEKAVTRQEMFTLLYNALKALNKLPTTNNGKTLTDFNDSGSMAAWATEAMTTLVKSGIITGSDGKLDPMGGSTRAQMAQVLYSLLVQ